MEYHLTPEKQKRFVYELTLPLIQAKIGKHEEFEAALQKLRGKDADISQEATEIQVSFLKLYITFKIDNG